MIIPPTLLFIGFILLIFLVFGLYLILQGHKLGAMFDLSVHKLQGVVFYIVVVIGGAMLLLYFTGKIQ